jgi:hypothetical protein
MLVDRVERLTAEHSALMDEVGRKWIGVGKATRPADRAAAVSGVDDAYRAAGLEPPRTVVWVDSPLAGVLCSYHLSSMIGHEPGNSVLAHLNGHVGYRYVRWIGDGVGEIVRAGVGRRVSARVPALRRGLRGVLTTQAGSALWNRIGERAAARIPARIRDAGAPNPGELISRGLNSCVYGQFDAAELAVYDMYGRIGIEPCGRLAGIMRVARSAGMWWPMLDAVVLSERPVELHLDSQGRLHRATGPAIGYPDGWGMHAWHGLLVPPSLVRGEGWSIDRIIRHPDSEIRRCAVERAAERDGTRGQYVETVPVDLTDPVAAAAWQIGDRVAQVHEVEGSSARVMRTRLGGSRSRDGGRRCGRGQR